MSDITINNDGNQNKKRKMTPIAESSMVAESRKLGLPTSVLQIWQGLKDDYQTYCGIISFSDRGEDNA